MERVIDLLTVEEAARTLQVGAGTLWRYIQNGKLTPSQVSGRYVISRMQLMIFARSYSSELQR